MTSAARVRQVSRRRSAWCVVALLAGCAGAQQPPFDYDAACRTGKAPVATAADLRRVSDTIEAASNGEYQPTGKDVEAWSAAVLLADAARRAAAPYALPSELHGNLPRQPDTTEVRALQDRLRTACAARQPSP